MFHEFFGMAGRLLEPIAIAHNPNSPTTIVAWYSIEKNIFKFMTEEGTSIHKSLFDIID